MRERTLTALEDMTWTFDNIVGIVEVVSLTLNMATRWMVILVIDLFAREEWGCFGEYRVASKGHKCYSDSHFSESRIMDLWRVDMLLVRGRRRYSNLLRTSATASHVSLAMCSIGQHW